MKPMRLLSLNIAVGFAAAFVGPEMSSRRPLSTSRIFMSSAEETATAKVPINGGRAIDPKEAVKLFGRLAEDYIMLDPTGGLCCYAGCRDCAHRNPDGSYKLTVEEAEMPMWIPSYVVRFYGTSDSEIEHEAKWGSKLFSDMRLALTKEDFIKYFVELEYQVPDLLVEDGPEVLAVADATITDTSAVEALWDVIAQDKQRLTRHKFMKSVKEMAGGGDYMTWTNFEMALGITEGLDLHP